MDSNPILLIIKDARVRISIKRMLEENGYFSETAPAEKQAPRIIEGNDFSAIISDLKIDELKRKGILETAEDVPVVLLAVNGSVHEAVESLKGGASDYLANPFRAEAILKSLNHVIARKTESNTSEEYVKETDSPGKHIVTRNPEFLEVLDLARTIAPSRTTVLVQGESGTGKELLAAFIHQHSGRKNGPYVALNCAALPDTLTESELFGHEKGSFTGAVRCKKGKFELADKGTLVLDEISEMSLPLQAKLLRVLQEREIDRVGGSKPVPIDSRIIAISNVDLEAAVEKGKFRSDLFYRINVVPLRIPPLRKRRDDIPELVAHFLEKYSRQNQTPKKSIHEKALKLLVERDWRGNIRELENAVERAVLLCPGEVIYTENFHFPTSFSKPEYPVKLGAGMSVREMEKKLIAQTLKEVDNNRTHAAELLGISIRTLRNKLKEYREENQSSSGSEDFELEAASNE